MRRCRLQRMSKTPVTPLERELLIGARSWRTQLLLLAERVVRPSTALSFSTSIFSVELRVARMVRALTSFSSVSGPRTCRQVVRIPPRSLRSWWWPGQTKTLRTEVTDEGSF